MPKPVDVMIRSEARGSYGLQRLHVKHQMIEQNLKGRLILLIATGHTDRNDWLTVAQDERWGQSDSGPFSWSNDTGVSLPGVEPDHTASQLYAHIAGDHSPPATRRR